MEKLRTLQELRLLVRRFAHSSEQQIGMRANGWRLKPMRSQWGSCNSKGIIAINTRLMFLPDRLVAYIVHHEVAHLKIHSHDRSFRAAVELMFPDRLILDKQLHSFAKILREKI